MKLTGSALKFSGKTNTRTAGNSAGQRLAIGWFLRAWFCFILAAVPVCLPPSLSWGALQGQPITDNNFKLDIRHGPVVGPARKVALGGAYTAIAEGVESLSDNPAGAAFRPSYSRGTWDWDATLGWFSVGSNDYYNSGDQSLVYDNHLVSTLGFLGQYGRWGMGLSGTGEQYDLRIPGATSRYNFFDGNIALGGSFFDRQWTFGVSSHPVSMTITPSGNDSLTLLNLNGTGFTLGGIWHPDRGRLRLGASYSSAISSNQPLVPAGSGPARVNGLIVPGEVTMPAEGAVGIAYITERLEGRPLMIAADIRVAGTVENAVGVESFLQQTIQRSGERPTAGYHLGVELEAYPKWLLLRLGSYLEPSRFEGVSYRQHITGGFEARISIFPFFGNRNISLGYAFDVSRDYFYNFVSIGLWRL